MKKTVRIIAAAMLAIMLCLTFASCAKNNFDNDNDDEKKETYNGPNKDPKKAEAALKEAGYTVTLYEFYEADDDGVVAYLSGAKSLTDMISVAYYEDAESAKKGYEEAKEEFDSMKEALGDNASDWVCKRSGKIVYMGTKAAVKASRAPSGKVSDDSNDNEEVANNGGWGDLKESGIAASPDNDDEYLQAVEILEEAGYTVNTSTESEGTEGFIAVLSGYHEANKEFIGVVYFEDADSAEKGFEAKKAEMQALIDDMKNELGDIDCVLERVDNVIYAGTRTAVKLIK